MQIAKILGCRTIGIAGGADKCAWIVDVLGADGAIDYKSEDVSERLSALCPDGIDVYFDNVGGDILQACIGRMKVHGSIAVCGMISTTGASDSFSGTISANLRLHDGHFGLNLPGCAPFTSIKCMQ